MKLKTTKTLILLLCMTIAICFIGCEKNKEKEKDNETSSESTGENVIISSKENSYTSLDIEFPFEKFIWEKEKEKFQNDSLRLTADWDKHILIGSTTLLSTTPTDISALPNYFYGANSDHTALENAYHVPHYAISVRTDRIQVGEQSSCSFQLESTTYGDNLIIESVQLTGITNVLEDGGMELKELSPHTNGAFGFGSAYSYVESIIGESKNIATDESGDFNISTVAYNGTNVDMILIFSWPKDKTIDDALLTSIYWKPIGVSKMLHNQENISEFIGVPQGNNTVTKE